MGIAGGLAAAAAGVWAFGPPQGLATMIAGPPQQAAILVQAQKWGPIFGVEVDWIMAIAKVESNFRSGARNLASAGDVARGGAWGPMQVTLRTAVGIAAELARSTNPAVQATLQKWTGEGASLLVPDVGVMFGASLLGRLAREFNTFELTAAAYNAGAGAVRRHVAAGTAVANAAYVSHAVTAKEGLYA